LKVKGSGSALKPHLAAITGVVAGKVHEGVMTGLLLAWLPLPPANTSDDKDPGGKGGKIRHMHSRVGRQGGRGGGLTGDDLAASVGAVAGGTHNTVLQLQNRLKRADRGKGVCVCICM
jgi:hypothetical protein